MRPILRSYQSEEDYWRMREFLRWVFKANSRLERSWHVARLDYARWHLCLNCDKVCLEDIVYLWENASHDDRERDIVAIAMPEGGPGEVHLMIHPDYHTAELEEEMLSAAEDRLVANGPDGLRRLCVWSPGPRKSAPNGGPEETSAHGSHESICRWVQCRGQRALRLSHGAETRAVRAMSEEVVAEPYPVRAFER